MQPAAGTLAAMTTALHCSMYACRPCVQPVVGTVALPVQVKAGFGRLLALNRPEWLWALLGSLASAGLGVGLHTLPCIPLLSCAHTGLMSASPMACVHQGLAWLVMTPYDVCTPRSCMAGHDTRRRTQLVTLQLGSACAHLHG